MKIKITIKEDLTNVKIADKRKKIIDIIRKWLIEINSEKKQEFRNEFLSEKNDKYFKELKKAIGEFKGVGKIEVIWFLAEIILNDNPKNKILNKLHKEFIALRKERFTKIN